MCTFEVERIMKVTVLARAFVSNFFEKLKIKSFFKNFAQNRSLNGNARLKIADTITAEILTDLKWLSEFEQQSKNLIRSSKYPFQALAKLRCHHTFQKEFL